MGLSRLDSLADYAPEYVKIDADTSLSKSSEALNRLTAGLRDIDIKKGNIDLSTYAEYKSNEIAKMLAETLHAENITQQDAQIVQKMILENDLLNISKKSDKEQLELLKRYGAAEKRANIFSTYTNALSNAVRSALDVFGVKGFGILGPGGKLPLWKYYGL